MTFLVGTRRWVFPSGKPDRLFASRIGACISRFLNMAAECYGLPSAQAMTSLS
jgi:hypothetical protein